MPEMRMNSLKSRAMNCGPLSEMIRGLASRYFSLARCRITSTSVSRIDSRRSQCTRKRLNPSRMLHLTEERFLQFQLRRDKLSTPQPPVPFWARIALFLLILIPGILLSLISIGLVIFFFTRFFLSNDMLLGLVATGFTLVALWWGWTQIPLCFGKTIHRRMQRHGNIAD